MTRRGDPVAKSSAYVADDLDRGILRLLQADARRPFSAMARDLGVSDQTVARRYQRLRSRGGVRVVALAQPNINTQDLWVLRVRAGANLNTLANNLARRNDTAWMHCVSGPSGLELTGMVYRERGETEKFALLEQLSALASVVSATAQSCLHMYFGGPDSLLTKTHSAPPDDRCVTVDTRDRQVDPQELSETDRRLLAALTMDGRASVTQLCQASGLAQETVNQRLALFEASGILYFDVDFDPELLGFRSSVSLWANVTPSCLEKAGRLLATHAEISFAAATTGTTNLYAVAHSVDGEAMYRYLSGPLAQLPGLQTIETAPHIRGLKKAQRDPAD